MKALRKLYLIVFTLMLCALLPVLSSCGSKDVEGGVIYNGKWVVGCEDGITSAVVREGTIGIEPEAFANQKNLEEIIMPSTLTNVLSNAFKGCDALIEKRDGISYVANWAIDADKSLNEINVKDGCVGIASEAFYGCDAAKKVFVPDSVKNINSRAFYGCTAIEEITLPFVGSAKSSTINSHFPYIFGAANDSDNGKYVPVSLKKVTVTSALKIANRAFKDCTGISDVILTDTVTEIGDEAFRGCKSLNNFKMSGSVTKIGEYAFYSCIGLVDIDIPDGVSVLKKFTFTKCESLTEVTVPDSVTIIEPCVFGNCYNLKEVTLSKNIESIGQQAFDGCNLMSDITIPGGKLGYALFRACESLTSVTLGEGVTEIGDNAFYDCYNLKSVTVPTTLKRIGKQSFANCRSLTAFSTPAGQECAVTEIGEYAFYHCASLTDFTIPSTVKEIGKDCFRGCEGLVSRTENGIEIIDGWMVYALPAVTYAIIDESINGIASEAFGACESFSAVYLASGVSIADIKGADSAPVNKATIYNYSEEQPDIDGIFWHYEDGKPTIWQ